MQELAILLSSLAGVATAAAVQKLPRNKPQLLDLGANPHIRDQINLLKIEKEMLGKTIHRVYQSDARFTNVQRDSLLSKYQHRMGVLLIKLEKLEQASKYPDLGPVGNGLITVLDKRLSKMDQRLHELSSKMTHVMPERDKITDAKKPKSVQTDPKPAGKPFSKEPQPARKSHAFDSKNIPPDETKTRRPFEITTLTSIPDTKQELPPLKVRARQENKKPAKQETAAITVPKHDNAAKPTVTESSLTNPDVSIEVAKINKHKALPEPKAVNINTAPDDDFDDGADEIDKIKVDIKKVLAKLDQAEVE